MGQFARKFLANYTILVAGDLCSKILLLWASVRIARVLGAGLFGDIAFATAFTAYFSLLVSQGLGNYGMQEVARQPSRVGEYVGAILALRFTASLLAASALGVTVWLLHKPFEIKVLLLLFGLLFFTSAISLAWVFQGLEQMKYVAMAGVMAQFTFSACILIFLDHPDQYAWIPIFQFAGEALQGLFLLFLYKRDFGRIRLVFDLRVWSAIWKDSLPIGLSYALGMVLYNFDVVLLGFMKPPSEVGQYGAAYKFINFFGGFLGLYSANILPAVSRCRDNPVLLSRISDRSLKYTLALTIPLAAGGTLVARPLMVFMFGDAFAPGAVALSILFWIIPVIAARAVYRATLLSHGFQRDFLWISLCGAAVNTGLNLALIPKYSFIGTAVTTIFGELLILALVYERVSRKVVTLALGSHAWKPAVACIPMIGFLLWYGGHGLPLLIGGGLAIYVVCAWSVGVINPKELWKELRPPAPASKPGLVQKNEGLK
jgi:O-antigen/teichoic acid export membrane protein